MCLLDRLKLLVKLLQMGLEGCRLREAGELAQRQAADELHLRVLGSVRAVLIQNGRRRRIFQDVLYLAVE